MPGATGILGAANPYIAAAGVGASLIPEVASLFGKIGQGRRTANQFVQGYQNPLGQVLSQVVQMRDSGNTQGAQQLLQQGLQQFYQGVQQFQGQGGDFAKVVGQALNDPTLTKTISSVASSLGYTYASGSGLVGGNMTPSVTGPVQGGTGTSAAGSGGAGGVSNGNPGVAGPGSTSTPTQTPMTTLPNGAQQGPGGSPATPGAGGTSTFNPQQAQAQATLYGLQAPTQQGDPFALNPNGYSPATVASMKDTAMEAPAASGQQQMGQAKRALSQAGIFGSPAAAGYQGGVAQQVGYQQGQNLNQVQQTNANVGLQNSQLNWQELNNRYGAAQRALTGAGTTPIGG